MKALCPACERPVSEKEIVVSALTSDFSSRSGRRFAAPEYAECPACRIRVSLQPPDLGSVSSLARGGVYAASDFRDLRDERAAAATYLRLLPRKTFSSALEIGCGHGEFLRALRDRGATRLLGYEPDSSVAPIAGVEIRARTWDANAEPQESFELIACLQTLEHLPDPRAQLSSFRRHLRPDGILLLCSHDFSHPVNRLLGRHSPILDPQHLHLFTPRGLTALLRATGWTILARGHYWNSYPVATWARLAPLPAGMKNLAQGISWKIPLPAGNQFVLATVS